MKHHAVLIVSLIGMAQVCWSTSTHQLAHILDNPLGHLPVIRNATVYQVSSYDRMGGNDDGYAGTYSYLRRTANKEFVLFEQEAPGAILRFWMQAPPSNERIMIYFDGESKPRIDLSIESFFSGTTFPFLDPLVNHGGNYSGGFYSYLPMPFARSCRVVTTGQPKFYHITACKFPPNKQVTSFSPQFNTQEKSSLYGMLQSCLTPDLSTGCTPLDQNIAISGPVAPASHTTLTYDGEGIALQLELEFAKPLSADQARNASLAVAYDSISAFEISLYDMFGLGRNQQSWQSLLMDVSSGRVVSRWPMPFRAGIEVSLRNTGLEPLPLEKMQLTTRPTSLNENIMYFHPVVHQAKVTAGETFPLLSLTGQGKIVGVQMTVNGPSLIYLEGDERIVIDGNPDSWYGTGMEDFFNSGWLLTDKLTGAPFHGTIERNEVEGRYSAYRWLVLDSIDFQHSICIEFEHQSSLYTPPCNYHSVAFTYITTPTAPQKLHAPCHQSTRTKVHLPPGVIQMESLGPPIASSRGPWEITLMETWNPSFVGTHIMRLMPSRSLDWYTFQFELLDDDYYQIEFFHTQSPVAGKFRIEINDMLLDGELIGYATETISPTKTIFPDGIFLTSGTHEIRFNAYGEPLGEIGLDGLRLYSLTPFAEDFFVLGPFDSAGGEAFRYPLEPELEPLDLNKQYTGIANLPITWMPITADANGFVDLRRFYEQWAADAGLEPHTVVEEAIAYLVTFATVSSPIGVTPNLRVGSDDSVKVWFNGEAVLLSRGQRSAIPDFFRRPVEVEQGWNTVFLKVENMARAWGIYLRMSGKDSTIRWSRDRQ